MNSFDDFNSYNLNSYNLNSYNLNSYLHFNFHEYLYQFLFLFPEHNLYYNPIQEIDLEANTTWMDLALESMYNNVEEEDDAYIEKNKQTFGYYDVEIGEYVL
jgi:hypothetical protein